MVKDKKEEIMPRRKMTEEEKKIARIKRKEKEKIASYKRAINYSLKDCLKTINRGDINKPPYILKIGDRVTYGAWDWSTILEVYDEGRYYKVFSITKEIKYGEHIGAMFKIEYHLWTDIRPYRNPRNIEKIEILKEENDIFFSYQQRDISSILHSIYGGAGLDLEPDYQRDHVWGIDQKIALIDSIFKNVDIGKFTIIRRPFSEKRTHYYEVLDGKQRIQALIDFFECRFEYKGKTYNDLHWRDRNHFKGYSVSWAETEPLTNEQKYRYFLKLNVSGIPMSEDQLNKVRLMWIKEQKKK